MKYLYIVICLFLKLSFFISQPAKYKSKRCYNSYQIAAPPLTDFYTVSFLKNTLSNLEFSQPNKDDEITIYNFRVCNLIDSNNNFTIKSLFDFNDLEKFSSYIPKLPNGDIVISNNQTIYVAWSYQGELSCTSTSTNALVYIKLFSCIEEAIKFYYQITTHLPIKIIHSDKTIESKVIINLDGSIYKSYSVGYIYKVLTENYC